MCDAPLLSSCDYTSLFLAESKHHRSVLQTRELISASRNCHKQCRSRCLSATTQMAIVLVVCALVLFGLTDANTGDSGKVRLVKGPNRYEGLVEVYLSDSDQGWTPVCNGGWDLIDGSILCTELGRPGAMYVMGASRALERDTRQRIIRVECNEHHSSILDCNYDIHSGCRHAAFTKCNYDGYLGCYNAGRSSDLTLPDSSETDPEMTIEMCLGYCRGLNMLYAGLTRGRQCHCGKPGTDYRRNGDASRDECGDTCDGNKTQICGGRDELSIYTTDHGACGGRINDSGIIYSPGFPGTYTGIFDCTWNILTPANTVIEVQFIVNAVHDESDSLKLYEKVHGVRRYLVLQSMTVVSCSNELVFQLHTSDSGPPSAKSFFAVEFTAVHIACQPPELTPYTDDGDGFDVIGECPYLYGHNVSIVCHTGYSLSSAHHSIVCQDDGYWNDTFPQCKVIDCGDPGKVQNADSEGNKSIYQSVVNYTCHDGFNGGGAITCTEQGTWSDNPICTAVDCGDPGTIDNANREGTSFVYPSVVKYTCLKGFNGGGDIKCTEQGAWTEKPECLAVDCGDPGEMAHAERYGSLFTFPHIVKYNCTEGFIGGGDILCTEFGTWTDKPECIPAGTLEDSASQVTVGLIAGVTIGVIAMIATIVAASIIVVRKRKAKSMSGSSDVILNNRSYGNVVSDSANQDEGRVQPLTQKNAHSYEELHDVKEDYTKLQFQETRFMSGNAVKSGMQAATGKKAGESFKVIQDQSVSPNGSDNEYAYAKFDDIGVKTDNVDSSQGLSQKIQRGYNHGKNLLNPNHEGNTFERQQKQVPGNDSPQAEGHVVAAPEAELPKKYQASGDVMTENIAYESASDVNSGFTDNVIYESNADEENPENVRHSNDLQTNCRGDSSRNHDSNKEVKYDGMVENIAYELTDDVEDHGDVYAEIADTGAENVDVEGGVDNILYESGTLENADDVEYYVLEGP